MAAPGTGFSRIEKDRRFEDYRSMKQAYQHKSCKEFIISGTGTTANAEFEFTSDTVDYPAAEDQVYIRTELNDATQVGKYVYIEYCDDDGVIKGPLGAVHAADTSDEVIITGASDFFRLRRMWCQVASLATKAIQLTDDDMDAATHYGFIEDGETAWAAQRYFVPSATQVDHSYLGRILVEVPHMLAAAAAIDAVILTLTYTPKVIAYSDYDQLKAAKTLILPFNENLDWEPCIELEPATDVVFSWNHTTTGQTIWFEADFLEVYPS